MALINQLIRNVMGVFVVLPHKTHSPRKSPSYRDLDSSRIVRSKSLAYL